MNPIVYHIASGQAFFTGVVLVLLAALLSLRESSLARRVMVLSFLVGLPCPGGFMVWRAW
jgi:acyl-CoA thioesterase I